FLGLKFDPVIVGPPSGTPYNGKSPNSGSINLELPPGIDRTRLAEVRELTGHLEASARVASSTDTELVTRMREKAYDMLLNPAGRDTFNLEVEADKLTEPH